MLIKVDELWSIMLNNIPIIVADIGLLKKWLFFMMLAK